jgi:hypothetical protein
MIDESLFHSSGEKIKDAPLLCRSIRKEERGAPDSLFAYAGIIC